MTASTFQKRVYAALSEVPRGRVTTYKFLAERLNCGSCQAIGQALRRNPFAPRVPCHRVIASNLSVGGFGGARAGALIRRKRELLASEGVAFRDGKLADPTRVFRWPSASCSSGAGCDPMGKS